MTHKNWTCTFAERRRSWGGAHIGSESDRDTPVTITCCDHVRDANPADRRRGHAGLCGWAAALTRPGIISLCLDQVRPVHWGQFPELSFPAPEGTFPRLPRDPDTWDLPSRCPPENGQHARDTAGCQARLGLKAVVSYSRRAGESKCLLSKNVWSCSTY